MHRQKIGPAPATRTDYADDPHVIKALALTEARFWSKHQHSTWISYT